MKKKDKEQKYRKIQICLPPALLKKLDTWSGNSGDSRSEVIRIALRKILKIKNESI